MSFPNGEQVVRLRRAEVLDPYSGTVTLGDWDDPDELDLEGAYVASSSTSARRDAARNELLEEKSLYLDDPHADVQAQDRIRAQGVTYQIDGMPTADVNPWTGWQPIREIPLTRVSG
ncbi:hypothetical protein [Leucobacter ruminantium]|uniref:Head-to-tail stopper n=1 Tax=Leucobacter ruminantium TaxID=1289170 RepID=A0A939LWQ7_9MICO|nr:hypothetical protein [Leucobacter ruminantium]MBO1805841.1 hypothetical protein [Leucobacter ruminantium]